MIPIRMSGVKLLLCLAVIAGAAAQAGLAAASDPKPISVIAGTVFREPGFALPGASVVLEPVEPEKGRKPKVMKFTSDAHGEYSFRLPAAERKYKLTVTALGFVSQTKETASAPGVRVDVFFELKPETR